MKTLVISDIHDNIANLRSALSIAQTSECDSIICCGDMCSPFVIEIIDKNCDVPVHLIYGNNDGDRHSIIMKINQANSSRKPDKRIHIHGEFILAEKEHAYDGIPSENSFAVYHYPEMAAILAGSGLFDFVFCGHTHKSSLETIKLCTFANPGSILGYVPGKNEGFVPPSCLIVNWNTKQIELIEF